MIYVSTKQTKYFIVTRFQKMFGLLISGRLVDTNFREVDTTHAVIDVPDADNFNHVVVSPKYTQIVTNLLIWITDEYIPPLMSSYILFINF